jgi:hypothetical protein
MIVGAEEERRIGYMIPLADLDLPELNFSRNANGVATDNSCLNSYVPRTSLEEQIVQALNLSSNSNALRESASYAGPAASEKALSQSASRPFSTVARPTWTVSIRTI